MNFNGLLHINIRCAVSDLPTIEKFYGDVVGLRKGYRPNFQNEGIWLYHGDSPIVHVSARFNKTGRIVKGDQHNGSVDHIAFNVTGVADFQKRLKKLGVAFEEQNVPEAGYQIFLHDPVGTKLEFNFPNGEAPKTIALGTVAPMQMTT